MKKLSSIILLLLFCGSVLAQVENLVFEGAGIRGIAYCGALQELDARGELKTIKRVAGTSSGAITSGLLAVGYTPQEIYDVIGSTNFAKFNDGGWFFIGGIHRLKKKLGYYKGDAFLHWLEKLIVAKTGNKDITFQQLYDKHLSDGLFKELVVTATSLNHQEAIIFSRYNYPNMRIADAIRASMAVPYYFEPMIIDENGKSVELKDMKASDHICVDGGFTTNFPIYIFDQAPYNNPNTLGFRIDSNEQIAMDRTTREIVDMPINDVQDYSVAFYYHIKETMNRYMLTEQDWSRTRSISDCNIGPKVKKLSQSQKDLLIAAGKAAV